MTTGVDAQTCKLVVLDQRINSMTDFKQIIGRGTRINEDYGKFWFTIMDFKKATELFADPDFDGDPVMIYEPQINETPVPPDNELEEIMLDANGNAIPDDSIDYDFTVEQTYKNTFDDSDRKKRIKYYVNNVEVHVVSERVQYYGPDGKLITESLKDYTRRTIRNDYQSLDHFLRRWSNAKRKATILQELEEHGVFLEALAETVGKDFDAFDLICHVAFDQPPLTRRERAEQVKKRNYFTKYGTQARKVLENLLEKYADTGIENIEDIKILTIEPFKNMGTPGELVSVFGGKDAYLQAVNELKINLYPTL